MKVNGKKRVITNENERPVGTAVSFPKREVTRRQLLDFVTNELLLSRQALINSQLLDPNGRDIDLECGYPIGELSPELYWMLYEKVGIANRVVGVYPAESWSIFPVIYENEDVETTPFEEKCEELFRDLNIWSFLERIDEMSGISRFGGLFLGLADGAEPHVPAPGWGDDATLGMGAMTYIPQPGIASPTWNPVPGVGVDGMPDRSMGSPPENKLLFIRAFDESNIRVNRFETNFANPRYGQPVEYLINIVNPLLPTSDQGPATANLKNQIRVHWSRVLHVTDNRKSSEVFGLPRMRPVLAEIMDIRKIRGGSAEMFWRGAFPGYSFETNPALGIEVELDKDSIREEFENYSNGLQRYMAFEGITAKSLAPTIASPEKHLEEQYRSIAATLGVPLRILMGSEAGHLASTQDLGTWYRRVQKRQKYYIEPFIIRPFILRMIAMGILPSPRKSPNSFTIHWPDLNNLSPTDKADVALKQTQALTTYVTGGVEQIMPVLEYYINVLGLSVGMAKAIVKKAMRKGRKKLVDPNQGKPESGALGGGRNGGDRQGDYGSPGTDGRGQSKK